MIYGYGIIAIMLDTPPPPSTPSTLHDGSKSMPFSNTLLESDQKQQVQGAGPFQSSQYGVPPIPTFVLPKRTFPRTEQGATM